MNDGLVLRMLVVELKRKWLVGAESGGQSGKCDHAIGCAVPRGKNLDGQDGAAVFPTGWGRVLAFRVVHDHHDLHQTFSADTSYAA